MPPKCAQELELGKKKRREKGQLSIARRIQVPVYLLLMWALHLG